LITRPEPGASETAARVAALGYRPVVAPLLEISTLQATLPPSAHVQAILATSGNAIPALPVSHRHLPLFAVGEATAERARAAGFVHVSSADGDSSALAALVAQSCDRCAGPLLFACGRDQGQALAGDLRARGFAVVRRVVYAAPETARAAFASGSLTAALFFSAETARHCVRLLRAARLHEAVRSVDALAIGRPAAVALQELTWRRTSVAAQPNQDAMLALLR
jgi:uroporphyrinogen-III synthase